MPVPFSPPSHCLIFSGVITLGDPMLKGRAILPGVEKTEYEYNCPEDCTNNWPHEIYAIGSFLHMHQVGAQV